MVKKVFLLLLVLVSICGCRTTKQVTAISDVRDSVRYIDHIRDSVNMVNIRNVIDSVRYRDSIVITLDSAGNERHRAEYHYRDTYKEIRDSVDKYKAKSDSLENVKQTVKTDIKTVVVEKKLTWWQRMKIDYLGWAILLLIIPAGYGIYRVVRKFALR